MGRLINAQREPDGRELDEGEEVGRVFLIARCDAPALLDPVEESLNVISVAVEVWGVADRITTVPARRNIRRPLRAHLGSWDEVADVMLKAKLDEQD